MFEIVNVMAEWCAVIIEVIGICIITGLAFYTLICAAFQLYEKVEVGMILRQVRQRFGRGILLGLEFLIAADIIRTIAVELTFSALLFLGVLVLIRTFLSFTLEVELTGHWPWQQEEQP